MWLISPPQPFTRLERRVGRCVAAALWIGSGTLLFMTAVWSAA
ncbi:hypothetical protein RAS1_35000 [Phycisphaerae bacterium RAS1]|nr:hypothetical protein RAS1_35000 [Phycisphaerae bacterium RAS1]